MGALSDAAANKVLDAIHRNVSFTGTATTYCQLHTGAPGTAGTSNVSSDTSGRKVISFGAPASNVITSNVDVIWSALALSGAETITHVSMWDAVTSGNYLGQAALPVAKAVVNGDALQINSGDVTCTGSGDGSTGILDNILNAVFRNTALVSAAVYAQMHTGDPGAAGTSNVAASSTRVVCTFGTAAASRTIANTAATLLSFTATETVTWLSFWSAVTGGTYLFKKAVTSAAGANGDKMNMAIGALTDTIT